jgi:hypothetical protein
VLAGAISVQRRRYAWVAALEAQEGRITCKELVDRFGTRALYDYDQAGDVIDPPIAYKILEGSGTQRRWPVRSALVSQLYRILTTTPGPWLANDRHYEDINYLSEWHSRTLIEDETLRSVAALLALPLFELKGERQRPGEATRSVRSRSGPTRRHPKYARDRLPDFFMGDRPPAGDKAPGPRKRRPVDDLQLLPEADFIVRAWVAGEVSFRAEQPSGRLRSEAADT